MKLYTLALPTTMSACQGMNEAYQERTKHLNLQTECLNMTRGSSLGNFWITLPLSQCCICGGKRQVFLRLVYTLLVSYCK